MIACASGFIVMVAETDSKSASALTGNLHGHDAQSTQMTLANFYLCTRTPFNTELLMRLTTVNGSVTSGIRYTEYEVTTPLAAPGFSATAYSIYRRVKLLEQT